MKPICVHFACNHPDSGRFTGQVEAVHFGDMLDLESWMQPRRLVELDGKIRFAGKTWPVVASKEWIGNWCWNGYWMKPEIAVRFLIWLHGRKLFTCNSGWVELYDLWDTEAPLNARTIMELLWKEAA